jgi:hypothetical protein
MAGAHRTRAGRLSATLLLLYYIAVQRPEDRIARKGFALHTAADQASVVMREFGAPVVLRIEHVPYSASGVAATRIRVAPVAP